MKQPSHDNYTSLNNQYIVDEYVFVAQSHTVYFLNNGIDRYDIYNVSIVNIVQRPETYGMMISTVRR